MITGLIHPSRWRDQLRFTIRVSLLGTNMALTAAKYTQDVRITLALKANICAVTFDAIRTVPLGRS
jgi:hypothetical protein